MSQDDEKPAAEAAALRAELEAVKRREAKFRSDMVQEFLDRGERNTYVHTLHEERAALRKREQEASADIEQLTRKLEASEARNGALDLEIRGIKRSTSWRMCAPFRAFGRMLAPAGQSAAATAATTEGAVFTYYLHTSPFRIYREPTFTLRGWAWPQDGGSITGIRVNVSGREFAGRCGIEEPEVIARYGPQPSNPRPGFEVSFDTPQGRQSLSIEAQVGGAQWRSIMRTSIWCEPGP